METESAALARRLSEAGLWDGLPESVRNAERARVADGGYPFTGDAIYGTVMFNADGERLAEFGIERFLQEIAPEVAEYGVVLKVERIEDLEEWGEPPLPPYPPMVINGQRVQFIDLDEGDGDHEDSMEYLATVRPLAYVNTLLAAAGARVRFHTLNTGTNDGFALLIDPRAAEAVGAVAKWQETGVPLLAVDSRLDSGS